MLEASTPPLRIPPGPRGLPFIGNVLGMRAAGDMVRYFDGLWKAHGDVFHVNMLGRQTVVLAHPEALKQVLSTRRHKYVKGAIYDGIRRMVGNGLLTAEGDTWKQRRMVMQPAFHRQALARLTETMVASGARFFDGLLREANGAPLEIEAHRQMVRLTLDVVMTALFGEGGTQSATVSYDTLGEALELISESSNGIVLPAWVPTPHNLKFNKTLREFDDAMYAIIRSARARGGNDGSLLSMLLAAVDETGAPLSDQAVRDEVITLFIAGHETTALTLTWLFTLIEGRPEVLARMNAEVATVLGGREPSFEEVPKLVYLRQVVEETLRLRPPVPVVPRNVIEDDEIGGYRVKKGELVLLLFWATHRHLDFWADPETFDPDRFEPSRSKAMHSWAFIPFSAGPRICIGNMFTLVETSVLLAQLLTRFQLEVKSCAGVVPVSLATCRPSGPVRVLLRPKVTSAATRTAPAQAAAKGSATLGQQGGCSS